MYAASLHGGALEELKASDLKKILRACGVKGSVILAAKTRFELLELASVQGISDWAPDEWTMEQMAAKNAAEERAWREAGRLDEPRFEPVPYNSERHPSKVFYTSASKSRRPAASSRPHRPVTGHRVATASRDMPRAVAAAKATLKRRENSRSPSRSASKSPSARSHRSSPSSAGGSPPSAGAQRGEEEVVDRVIRQRGASAALAQRRRQWKIEEEKELIGAISSVTPASGRGLESSALPTTVGASKQAAFGTATTKRLPGGLLPRDQRAPRNPREAAIQRAKKEKRERDREKASAGRDAVPTGPGGASYSPQEAYAQLQQERYLARSLKLQLNAKMARTPRTLSQRNASRLANRAALEAAKKLFIEAEEQLSLTDTDGSRIAAEEMLAEVDPEGCSLLDLRAALAAGKHRPERTPRWDEL
jgi:hypothetical protein